MSTDSQLLQAVHLAARRLTSNERFDTLLREVLAICIEAVGAEGGTIYVHDKPSRRLMFRHVLPQEVAQTMQLQDIPDDFGVAGKVFHMRKTEFSRFDEQDPQRKHIEERVGVHARTMITVPLMMEDEEPIGVVQIVNKRVGEFDADDATVLDTISAISTMAYLNSVLLEEQTRSSQLLGMGKVAHDIKNMAFSLEASMLYSDQTLKTMRDHVHTSHPKDCELREQVEAVEEMFGELKQSIERIKRYSILMSDISAGKKLQPDLQLSSAAACIETAASYLESEGRACNVALEYEVQRDAPPMLHDELYLFRIVQNLVSNAIKAVAECVTEEWRRSQPDAEAAIYDKVIVRYGFEGGRHELAVEDHGKGMSPETARRILSGTALSVWGKSSGSGWGTKIVLELASAMHGTVSIDSEPGRGTIFRVRFPEASA